MGLWLGMGVAVEEGLGGGQVWEGTWLLGAGGRPVWGWATQEGGRRGVAVGVGVVGVVTVVAVAVAGCPEGGLS